MNKKTIKAHQEFVKKSRNYLREMPNRTYPSDCEYFTLIITELLQRIFDLEDELTFNRGYRQGMEIRINQLEKLLTEHLNGAS